MGGDSLRNRAMQSSSLWDRWDDGWPWQSNADCIGQVRTRASEAWVCVSDSPLWFCIQKQRKSQETYYRGDLKFGIRHLNKISLSPSPSLLKDKYIHKSINISSSFPSFPPLGQFSAGSMVSDCFGFLFVSFTSWHGEHLGLQSHFLIDNPNAVCLYFNIV